MKTFIPLLIIFILFQYGCKDDENPLYKLTHPHALETVYADFTFEILETDLKDIIKVKFNAEASKPEGEITNIMWDFGDGNHIEKNNMEISFLKVTHIYNKKMLLILAANSSNNTVHFSTDENKITVIVKVKIEDVRGHKASTDVDVTFDDIQGW